MFTRLLLPVDGSECSDRATDHALELADRYDASVHVLSVVDAGDFPVDLARIADDAAVHADLEARGRTALDDAVDRLESAGVEVTSEQRTGSTTEEILSCADEAEADLIVAGRDDRDRLGRFLHRSISRQLAQAAAVPVLAVPAGETSASYASVLLAADGRPGSARATDCAFDLAGAYGASLHLLSVVDERTARHAALKTALQRELTETQRRLEARAARSGVDVSAVQREGRPANEILAYAESTGVDLLVLGTRGLTGLDRLVLGSVAAAVLRRSSVPVLTARTPAAE